jgi:hypothetical protein
VKLNLKIRIAKVFGAAASASVVDDTVNHSYVDPHDDGLLYLAPELLNPNASLSNKSPSKSPSRSPLKGQQLSPVCLLSPSMDVWSIGVCFHRMLTGEVPFFVESSNAKNNPFDDYISTPRYQELYDIIYSTCKQASSVEVSVPDYLSADCAELLHGLLHFEADRRIALNNAWDMGWMRSQSIELPPAMPQYASMMSDSAFMPQSHDQQLAQQQENAELYQSYNLYPPPPSPFHQHSPSQQHFGISRSQAPPPRITRETSNNGSLGETSTSSDPSYEHIAVAPPTRRNSGRGSGTGATLGIAGASTGSGMDVPRLSLPNTHAGASPGGTPFDSMLGWDGGGTPRVIGTPTGHNEWNFPTPRTNGRLSPNIPATSNTTAASSPHTPQQVHRHSPQPGQGHSPIQHGQSSGGGGPHGIYRYPSAHSPGLDHNPLNPLSHRTSVTMGTPRASGDMSRERDTNRDSREGIAEMMSLQHPHPQTPHSARALLEASPSSRKPPPPSYEQARCLSARKMNPDTPTSSSRHSDSHKDAHNSVQLNIAGVYAAHEDAEYYVNNSLNSSGHGALPIPAPFPGGSGGSRPGSGRFASSSYNGDNMTVSTTNAVNGTHASRRYSHGSSHSMDEWDPVTSRSNSADIYASNNNASGLNRELSGRFREGTSYAQSPTTAGTATNTAPFVANRSSSNRNIYPTQNADEKPYRSHDNTHGSDGYHHEGENLVNSEADDKQAQTATPRRSVTTIAADPSQRPVRVSRVLKNERNNAGPARSLSADHAGDKKKKDPKCVIM